MNYWSNEKVDLFLETVLPSTAQQFLQRAYIKVYKELGDWDVRPQRIPDEGAQLLRRLSDGYKPYEGPANENTRTSRIGKPFTFAEITVLEKAFSKTYNEVDSPPSFEYLAVLLQRTPEEVKKENEKRLSTRLGIKGFF